MPDSNKPPASAVKRAVATLAKGNSGFVDRNNAEFFASHRDGQKPFITMVTCSDSRVQTRVILPDAVNRIFVIRNIGNQIATCEGSVDYGIIHLNTPVLLIMGHADCGAIKAFMGGYQGEPIPIRKELDHMRKGFAAFNRETSRKQRGGAAHEDEAAEQTAAMEVPRAVQANVDHQVSVAVAKYADLVRDGKLAVIGGFYDFRNDAGKGHGRLSFININGETDLQQIERSPVIAAVESELRKSSVTRL